MIKHLELIQSVIARLSAHSFRLKTLTLVKVAALLLAFSSSEGDSLLLILAPIAAALLWGLDAWFLREERAYRRLYDHVRKLQEEDVDFAMDVAEFRGSLRATFFSATLGWFYLMLVGLSATAVVCLAVP